MPAKHPNKHVREVIAYAESRGWTFHKAGRSGHAFGFLRCPRHTREGCIVAVYSTPRNVEDHARRIRRAVDACPHII
jgi:hypothetical protein